MTTLWPEQRLQEVEARLKAATPGPWLVAGDDPNAQIQVTAMSGGLMAVVTHECVMPRAELEANAELIAGARTDLADAVAEIRRLQAALVEAADEFDNASLYKGDYLREKHGDAERAAEFRRMAGVTEAPSPPATDSPGTG